MSEALDFTVNLDTAWWPLGDGTDDPAEIAEVLISTLAPELTGPVATALNANLVTYAEWSQMLAAGERRSYALVRTPELGRVDALLSWRYSEIPAEGFYERYLQAARDQRSTETVELVNQRVLEYQLPTGRAVAIHDALVIRDGGLQQPARERCTVGLFLDSGPFLLEQHIATLDLALFDDIVEYSLSLLTDDDPGVPGLLQYGGEG